MLQLPLYHQSVLTAAVLGVAFLTFVVLAVLLLRRPRTEPPDTLVATTGGILAAAALLSGLGCAVWWRTAAHYLNIDVRERAGEALDKVRTRRAERRDDDGEKVARWQAAQARLRAAVSASDNDVQSLADVKAPECATDSDCGCKSKGVWVACVSEAGFPGGNLTAVHKGETVRWINKTASSQTITSTDANKTLDSGFIAKGDTYEHTFDTAGTYEYLTEANPGLGTARITVVA